MENVEGDVPCDVTNEMRRATSEIVSQLKQFILALRSINGIFIGSACEDPVFGAESSGFGPYQTGNDGLVRISRHRAFQISLTHPVLREQNSSRGDRATMNKIP